MRSCPHRTLKVPVTFTHLSVHCGGNEVARIPLGGKQ